MRADARDAEKLMDMQYHHIQGPPLNISFFESDTYEGAWDFPEGNDTPEEDTPKKSGSVNDAVGE